MKIMTEIIASLTGSAAILVLMSVETFKTDVIVFIGNIIMFLTSHWWIIVSICFSPLILKISVCEIKGKVYNLLINLTKVSLHMGYMGQKRKYIRLSVIC